MALFFDDLPKVAYSESKIPWNSVSNASTATSLSNSIHSRTDVIDDIGSDDQSTDFLPHSNLFSALESLSESAEANQPLSPLTSGALLSYESELRAKSRSCGSDSSRRTHFPSAAQKLACRSQTQADDVSSGITCTSAPVEGVALDAVHTYLNSQDTPSDNRAARRFFALQELGILVHGALKGGHASIDAAVNCLQEKDDQVFATAIDALKQFAMKGGGRDGIVAVVSCLEEKGVQVCQATVEALKQFAMTDEQPTIAALIEMLHHERSNVKNVALGFLGELTEVGDHHVVTEVCTCLEHHATSASVTVAAFATLCTLALRGDHEHIVACLTNLVGHKSKNVRKLAIHSLVTLSERGIAVSMSAVLAGIADAQSEVKIATLRAITKFAAKGDQEALFAVSDCLGDSQHRVRIASLKAIAQIAVKGNQDAMMAVSLSVEDTDSCVRLAALCAIAEIADKDDENAFAYSQLLGRPRHNFGVVNGQRAAAKGEERNPGGCTFSSGCTSSSLVRPPNRVVHLRELPEATPLRDSREARPRMTAEMQHRLQRMRQTRLSSLSVDQLLMRQFC